MYHPLPATLFSVLLALSGVASQISGQPPPATPAPFPVPHPLELSVEACALAADYSRASGGHAFLVIHHGRTILEDYHNGHTADQPHRLASGTKSFSGLIAAAALDDGLLTLDEPVAETITEWASDPVKSKITIRHLLTLTSGFNAPPGQIPPSYAEAIRQSPRFPPGERFNYGPVPFQVFGEVMNRKLEAQGLDIAGYLQRRVLDPIGVKPRLWRGLERGEPTLPSGCALTTREWSRVGRLVLDNGRAGDEQVLKPESLAAIFTHSPRNPAYAHTWWVNIAAGHEWRDPTAEASRIPGVPPFVYAAGAGRQILMIVPSRELIIVRLGETTRYDPVVGLRLVLGIDSEPRNPSEIRSELDLEPEPAAAAASENPPRVRPRDTLLRQFRRLDADADGSLTELEYASAAASNMLPFGELDLDKDGRATLDEIRRALAERLRIR